MTRFAPLVLPVLLLAGVAVSHSAEPKPEAKIDFNRDVRPILSNSCYACHGPDEAVRKGGLRLDTREGALENGIVAGKPDESEILKRILSDDPKEAMPPPKFGKKVSAKDVETLRIWIKQGANYATHWAYVKPVRPPVPTVEGGKNAVDAFLLARLKQSNLTFQPEADRYTLARRVALDLTGLPPTVAEVDEFVADKRPDAYELYVDRMLAKKSFGEHWARMWLDLARYADSAGYADDPPRTIWKYRDYVIQSFNDNKPFDTFTVEQMAGDLLPNPTEEQLIATAFHRNTMTNNEGGTNDEEFRTAAVVDRVNTTMAVWMGTSMACAQCHTHKYDPISQKEYFRVFAFLNNTEDADRRDESPLLSFYTETQKKQKAALEAEAAFAKTRAATLRRIPNQPAWAVKAEQDLAGAVEKAAANVKPATSVPIFRELPKDRKRVTKVQIRGNFLDTGDTVTEGVPSAFHPLPKGAELNRLTLAKWLVDTDNPLTARVTVNRFWESIFGSGLVRTSEEFGSQGELPSHPELLDWLATEFVAQKWDTKAFLKLLVTSAAYRQSSKVTPEALERDPDNRLVSRGPRFRLPAETVRDQALAVAGLLSPKMNGPSVRPARPSMGLSAAFGGGLDWKTSDGEDRYRRGLYTEWRRTSPYPSMTTFDAPSREACTIRRVRTNTPLQALVTLNDPVYVEAAQALARRMDAAGAKPEEKLTAGFRLVLSRPPTEKEVARLMALFDDAKAGFAKDPAKAAVVATKPLGPLPKGTDATELAGWTVVANVLLNLDETLMRR